MINQTRITMGKKILELRKEKGMTQADVAREMNVTDKAVSKWERDISCPDVNSLPRLAEVFDISVDELMQINNTSQAEAEGGTPEQIVQLVLMALTLAMGIAVIVLSILREIDVYSGFILLGIGLASAGICLLKNRK